VTEARVLMQRFAERTGVTSDRPPRRYLWTDAFAVCNFLGLWRATGDALHREVALRLVDQVHHTLGRHRADDARTGWISGLREDQGEAHPTRGGLRIGKALPERALDAPFQPELEWECDGQYFHYLTKWMHALDQVTRATGRSLYHLWACELAEVAHRTFVYEPRRGWPKRMFWKLSVDLSRPQVPSMGQHDPLDGLVSCLQLAATSAELVPHPDAPDLAPAIADFSKMIDPVALTTDDPLGLGGLLVEAYRLAQLGQPVGRDLQIALLGAADAGLRHFAMQFEPEAPAHRRLAFRELGLAIGLAGAAAFASRPAAGRSGLDLIGREILGNLARHRSLRDRIQRFWLDPAHRRVASWVEHEDINEVMLATSLLPDGFLVMNPINSAVATPQRSDPAPATRS
jgi:hypothetical protein